jgi:molybdate transport system substrate-binding protein
MNPVLPIVVAVAMAGAISLCDASNVAADDITLVAPGGMKAALDRLLPGFEQQTGHKVKATIGSGLGTKQQVARGDRFDVPIVQPPYPEVLASGNVVTTSATPLATVAVGVAVRTGQPKPDISTAEAVTRMLRAAKAVSYPDPAGGAAAGVSFNETLKTLGLADELKPKLKLARGGAAAMEALAKGETDIGITFVSEIITEPGVDVVGPLPRAISTPTALVGFLSTHAGAPEAAQALLRYLSSPNQAAVYKAVGMEPGR